MLKKVYQVNNKINNIIIYKKKSCIYNKDINYRRGLKIFNYKELSVDIPELITKELYIPNDFYGIATNIKKYINVSNRYQIKAAIEHGVYYSDYYWEADINSSFPVIFCPGEHRFNVLTWVTNKKIIKIGPTIAYANHFLGENELKIEQSRLGNNLLVFPIHSTHWIDVNYNIDKFCKYINLIAREFNNVRVCLYWKDILRGHDKVYNSYGYECVTAGHIYDPFFLPRLRSIIETSTVTMSNGLGTHLGFCIYYKKPHFLIEENVKFNSDKDYDEDCNFRLNKYNNDKDIRNFYNLFGCLQDTITQEQLDLANLYWGFSEVKSKADFKKIILTAEDL